MLVTATVTAESVCQRRASFGGWSSAGATRLFTLAESLGAVESLIELPGPMTHASVADSSLAVPANLVRLSVGIESVDDLRADLEAAFAASEQ